MTDPPAADAVAPHAGPPPPVGLTVTAVAPARPPAAPPAPDQFHQILSELNPLQYVPVVGTVYRAMTGDTIPEEVRELGGLAVSGLMGGPIGLVTNLACLALEKLTGIDPEALGQAALHDLGIGHAAPPAPGSADTTSTAGGTSTGTTSTAATSTATTANATTANATTATATTATGLTATAPPAAASPAAAQAAAATHPAHAVAWSPAQLTAYGVTRTATGDLRRGNITGADVLNDLELAREHGPAPAGSHGTGATPAS